MQPDGEWTLIALLVGLCAIGIVTAAAVGSMTAQAFALPFAN
jgi:hypothetical protein